MAQSAPRNIDLSALWSDGTGATPGAGWNQILKGSDRYNEYLGSLTRGCNRNAQIIADYGEVQLTGGLPQGYTLWVQTTGSKPVEVLYGSPRGNFRSALNFSDHIPELLAANAAKEIRIWNETRARNQAEATAAVDRYNEWATIQNVQFGLNHPLRDRNEYAAAWGLPGFRSVNEYAAVQLDRQNNPTIAFRCTCVFR
ncbi:hypothetical protein KCU65_g7729, partial [Aureobasidium melanogenum]